MQSAALLNLVVAALEGIGLLLLLPMLVLAGVLDQTQSLPRWFAPLEAMLNQLAPSQRLLAVLLFFVLVISLQSVLALMRDRKNHQLHLLFIDDLKQQLFSAIARTRWSYLSQRHSAVFVNIFTSEIGRVGAGTYYLLQLFTVGVLACAYLAVALQLSLAVTGLALLVGVLLALISRKTHRQAAQNGISLNRANRGLLTQIQEFLAALKLIKIHHEEAASLQQFQQALSDLHEQHNDLRRVQARAQLLHRIGGASSLALLTWFALTLAQVPAATLLVLITVFARLLPQLSHIQTAIGQLWHMLPAYQSIQRQLAWCHQHRESDTPAGEERLILRDTLSLRQIRYRHHEAAQTLHINELSIPARSTSAVLGASGSGKTTLLDLISGLTPPDEGELSLDGMVLPPASAAWRRGIAYIPQESVILDGTLRDNLRWGNGTQDDEQLWHALEQAAAAEFVRRLPHGLATQVGERGVRLSGGERQRLALARALLRQPQLLILDEATSALDNANRQLILSAIRRLHGHITILLTTHRPDELDGLIDGFIEVEHGKVSAWQAASTTNKDAPCDAKSP